MKKTFVLFSFLFTSSALADFENMCGLAGYHRMYAIPVQVTCSSGMFLPADSITCANCPSGYTCSGGTYSYNSKKAQGLIKSANNPYITGNENNICSSNIIAKRMYAIPVQVTCSSGTFLPADSITCTNCPYGYTCSGGTYSYSSKKAQGLTKSGNNPYITTNTNNTCASNTGHYITAIFTPNTHTCSAGYYLPANTDGCTICPANNACAGGTYSFNETLDQGIQSCASGTFAPAGSTVCYQHILHVGDSNVYLRSTKQTTPSLNIQIGNDIFYANMTTVPTYMNKDSSHYLHILYEGDDYYVCDDTTYVAPVE